MVEWCESINDVVIRTFFSFGILIIRVIKAENIQSNFSYHQSCDKTRQKNNMKREEDKGNSAGIRSYRKTSLRD